MSDDDPRVPDFFVDMPKPKSVREYLDGALLDTPTLHRVISNTAPIWVREMIEISDPRETALMRLASSVIRALNGIQEGTAYTVTDGVQTIDAARRRDRPKITSTWATLSLLLGYSVFVDQKDKDVSVIVDAEPWLIAQLASIVISNGYPVKIISAKQLTIIIP